MKPQIVAVIILLTIGCSLQAQISTSASNTITQQINALVSDYTDTTVIPTDGSDAVLVVSTKILSTKQIMDLWIFVSASAVGKHLNDTPSLRMNEIWFSDVAGMKSKPSTYYSLPTAIAKSVQSKIERGEITLQDGMRIVSQSISKKSIAKKTK